VRLRARDGRAVDQGGQSRDALDTPLLPPLPREWGPPALGSHRLQPRQSAPSAGPAVGHPELVADASSGMPGTSPCNSPKATWHGPCSGRSSCASSGSRGIRR